MHFISQYISMIMSLSSQNNFHVEIQQTKLLQSTAKCLTASSSLQVISNDIEHGSSSFLFIILCKEEEQILWQMEGHLIECDAGHLSSLSSLEQKDVGKLTFQVWAMWSYIVHQKKDISFLFDQLLV